MKYCDEFVCLFTYLSTCITLKPLQNFSDFFACCSLPWLSSLMVLLYVMYFQFCDDVMFSYRGTSGPESSTALCLEEFHQVAVPVGHQDNYGVWSGASECGTGDKV